MPKATLEFDLSDSQDDRKLRQTMAAQDMYDALYSIVEYTRQKHKYASENMSRDEYKTWGEIREKIYEELNDRGLDLESLGG